MVSHTIHGIPPLPLHAKTRLFHNVPNRYSPNAATTLNPIGNGFIVLIALGTELPANITDASKAISTP